MRANRLMGRLKTGLGGLLLAGVWLVSPGWADHHERPSPDHDAPEEDASQPMPPLDLAYLNIRLSTRLVEPPAEAIRQVVPLPGIRAARPRIGPSPRAAILEDDARRRAIILRAGDRDDMPLEALVLTDLDLRPHLPTLTRCTDERGCATDRRPGVGGLSCVAMCLIETLR